MQTQMQVAGGGGKCSGHGPARQYHLQHEQLRRRAGRPGLHSASVEPRWPSRFASTPWFSPPYRIVTRCGCALNEGREGQKSATTVCAGLMSSSTWECGGGVRRRASGVPCAGILCRARQHGTRTATPREKRTQNAPTDEHQEVDGPEDLQPAPAKLALITDAAVKDCWLSEGFELVVFLFSLI